MYIFLSPLRRDTSYKKQKYGYHCSIRYSAIKQNARELKKKTYLQDRAKNVASLVLVQFRCQKCLFGTNSVSSCLCQDDKCSAVRRMILQSKVVTCGHTASNMAGDRLACCVILSLLRNTKERHGNFVNNSKFNCFSKRHHKYGSFRKCSFNACA